MNTRFHMRTTIFYN